MRRQSRGAVGCHRCSVDTVPVAYGADAHWLWYVSLSNQGHGRGLELICGAVQSSLNSVCDITLTILPMVILWNLQMPLAQKVGLGLVLTLSVLYDIFENSTHFRVMLTHSPVHSEHPLQNALR
jgi:hypothetical protein